MPGDCSLTYLYRLPSPKGRCKHRVEQLGERANTQTASSSGATGQDCCSLEPDPVSTDPQKLPFTGETSLKMKLFALNRCGDLRRRNMHLAFIR